jgi:hypothetical protein
MYFRSELEQKSYIVPKRSTHSDNRPSGLTCCQRDWLILIVRRR